MTIEALDHFNIVTADLDRAEAFYRDLLGLESRPAPPPLTLDMARWMHDREGRAIVHLNSLHCPRMFDRDMSPRATGALHHIALRCAGHEAMVERLDRMGIAYDGNEVSAIGLRQLFVTDPEGVVLELNFFAD